MPARRATCDRSPRSSRASREAPGALRSAARAGARCATRRVDRDAAGRFEVNGVTLAARLVLFAVFAAAGAAKLRDLQATRYTLEDFGLSARAAGPVAVLLPLAALA